MSEMLGLVRNSAKISSVSIYIVKNFPGVILRTPLKRKGKGVKGKGKGEEGGMGWKGRGGKRR
jgi:hypothetical protein